jgi:hypothetical protein
VLDPNALDECLADVMRRLVGMRRILRGPDFETLVDALNVELDVAEMEAKGREIARTFRSRNNRKPSLTGKQPEADAVRPQDGEGNVIPFRPPWAARALTDAR